MCQPGEGIGDTGVLPLALRVEHTHAVVPLLNEKGIDEMADAISRAQAQPGVLSLNDIDPNGNTLCRIGEATLRPSQALLLPTQEFKGLIISECDTHK